MADAPPQIRFPPPRPSGPVLVLRRRPTRTSAEFSVPEATAEARRQIEKVLAASKAPWPGETAARQQAVELEQSLRQLEAKLTERERLAEAAEFRVADKEHQLAERAALTA